MQIIHDVRAELVESCGELAIRRTQVIPQEYMDHLADTRFDNLSTEAGEMHRVGAVPVGLVEEWRRKGFDVYTAPIEDILARLKLEGYDKFVTTNKRI
jgi:phage host-nuclease inhibitor protein Gam